MNLRSSASHRFSVVREWRNGHLAAERPGLVTRGIPNQESLSILRLYPEIIVPQIFGVQAAFIPPVHNLRNPVTLLLINEDPGRLFSLVSGITLNLNLLKDPFFIQNLSPQRPQRARSNPSFPRKRESRKQTGFRVKPEMTSPLRLSQIWPRIYVLLDNI